MHIRKGQGLTTETSRILAGGWQTDKEHIYVSLTRAREHTDIYISREDLGEQGMDTGAIERLGERMARSRAQEATITKDVAEPTAEPERTARPERSAEQPPEIEPATQATPERSTDQPAHIEPTKQGTPDRIVDYLEPERSAEPSQQHETPDQTADHPERQPSPERHTHRPVTPTALERITIDPTSDVSIYVQERDAIQWLEAIMRNQGATHDEFLGQVAKRYQGPEAKKLLAEDDREKEQKRQLHLDQIWFAEHKEQLERDEQLTNERQAAAKSIETGNGFEPERDALDPADQDLIEPSIDLTADPERETAQPVERDPYIEQAIQAERDRQQAWEQDTQPDRDVDRPEGPERDPYIEQAIQEERDRQRDWERDIDQDRDIDRGFEIE